ncbi:MAG: hypothetical protein M3Q47_09600, partial [Actinomycetota bacterium]|nr:hypothetical protein [Actinomycetota bacterium]
VAEDDDQQHRHEDDEYGHASPSPLRTGPDAFPVHRSRPAVITSTTIDRPTWHAPVAFCQ